MTGRPPQPVFAAVGFALLLAITACGDKEGAPTPPPDTSAPPSSEAVAYLRGAMRMAQRGDFEGAAAAVERAQRESPESAEVYLVSGQVRLAARDFEGAHTALEKAVSLQPSNAHAWEMMGHAAFQSRHFREALDHYRRSADLAPSPFIWQGIGSAYRELYRPDSAAMAYREVLAMDSTFAPALAGLAEIEEDEGAYADALAFAEGASRASPRTPAYQGLRARLLVRVGRAQEAIPLLEELVHRDSTDYAALYNLGLAYQQAGDSERARSTLERAARVRHETRARKPL